MSQKPGSSASLSLCSLWLMVAVLGVSLPLAAAEPEQGAIRSAWDRFYSRVALPGSSQPGKFVGDAASLRRQGADSDWRCRSQTWEAYFVSSADLARCVYTLALSAGDIQPDVSRERFEKGVQGFHYDLDQVSAWVNQVLGKQVVLQGDEERFLLWLLLDGVVEIRDGRARPGATVKHVLGAAPGKKRNLAVNLAHERLHVLWDEDATFRAAGLVLWKSLDQAEKDKVYQSLPGYSKDREEQIVEEWHVRNMEAASPEQRRSMVGI